VTIEIAVDDPRRADIQDLLRTHLDFATGVTPPGLVFALDTDGLLDASVTFFSARRGGDLVGIAALKEVDRRHGELKSMHTAAPVRGQGIGRAMVEHVLDVARVRGYERVSLETGAYDAFAAARAFYARLGIAECGAFGDYEDLPTSSLMTIVTSTL
jgi:putative acetyltransferase